jgi:two-component system, NtrC family, sensor kinase
MPTLIAFYNLLSAIPVEYPLYFFYGASFLFLGISISVKNMKGSELKLATGLWMLGVFGFLYGAHEWISLFPLIYGEQLSLQQIYLVRMFLLYLLLFALYFLLLFGLSLLSYFNEKQMRGIRIILFFAIFALASFIWIKGDHVDMLFIWNVEVGIRYTLGPMAGLTTAYGLIAYANTTKNLSRAVSVNFLYAGAAFTFYGIFGGVFVFHVTAFELHLISSFLRGLAAVFISFYMLKALNIFDIETRQKIEQQTRILVQSEKLSSLGRLAAGIAHDIRNPLTNASRGIRTLEKRWARGNVETGPAIRKIRSIEKSIDHASAIAGDFLQFYRAEGEDFAPVNINFVVNRVLALLEGKMKNIVFELNEAQVPEIMGSQGKLEQVFINVLTNSVEAMPKGGRIRISTVMKNDIVQVSVTDSGIGISKENLACVFDPFFTTREKSGNIGLGLCVAFAIIQQHQGTIDIFGAPAGGTTAIIKLPVRERYENKTATDA